MTFNSHFSLNGKQGLVSDVFCWILNTLNIDRLGLSIDSSHYFSTFKFCKKEKKSIIAIIFAQIFQLSDKDICGRWRDKTERIWP